MRNNKQSITVHSLSGEWISSNELLYGSSIIRVSITPKLFTIVFLVDGFVKHKISISSNAHWMGDNHLLITELQKYFISYANDAEMQMGELMQPAFINGEYKWLRKFKRVVDLQ